MGRQKGGDAVRVRAGREAEGKLFLKIDVAIATRHLVGSRHDLPTSVFARILHLEGFALMRSALFTLVATALVGLPALAHADTTDEFTVTGQGLELTFALPSTPLVGDDYLKGFYFYLGDVSFTENGTAMTAADVYFYTKPNDGGFSLDDANGNDIDGLDFTGPKLFTSGVKHPTFKEGTFNLTQYACGDGTDAEVVSDAKLGPCKYKLTIDPEVGPAPTPEPGSLALLGTGALGVFGVVRRRLSL